VCVELLCKGYLGPTGSYFIDYPSLEAYGPITQSTVALGPCTIGRGNGA